MVTSLTTAVFMVGCTAENAATTASHDLTWVPAPHYGGCLGTNLGVMPLRSDATPIMWVKSAPNDVIGDYQRNGQLSAQVFYSVDQATGTTTYGAKLFNGVLQPKAVPVANLRGTVVDCTTMSLTGDGWTATVKDGHLTGRNGANTIDLLHVVPVVPTQGQPAPQGAVTLFDGTDLSHWGAIDCQGTKDWTVIAGPAQWKIVDGAMEVVPDTCSIISREIFGSATIHVEFRSIGTPTHTGVFPQAQYQTTILQDYGLFTGNVTGNYGNAPDPNKPSAGKAVNPDIRAVRPPLEWQTLDITYTAPTFNSAGAQLTKAAETLVLNGITVFDHLELNPPGGSAARVLPKAQTGAKLPLLLEYHGMPVQFKNIWVQPH